MANREVSAGSSAGEGQQENGVVRRHKPPHLRDLDMEASGGDTPSAARRSSRRQSQQDILRSASDLLEFTRTFIDARKDPAVRSQYDTLYVFLGSLERVLKYLNVDSEVPVSEKARVFILTAVEELSAVEVGLVILYGALILGFHMLDATPGQYEDERNSIKDCVEFVKDSIKDILEISTNGLRILKQVIETEAPGTELASIMSPLRKTQREDNSVSEFPNAADIPIIVDEAYIAHLERQFQEEMRRAKLKMSNAEQSVEETRDTIRKANSEIKGHLLVAGMFKGFIIGSGVLGVAYMYKYSNLGEKKLALAGGLSLISLFWLVSGLPRYAALQKEFRTYEHQVVELRSRLRMLKREIESQEVAFMEGVRDARTRTNSSSKMSVAPGD